MKFNFSSRDNLLRRPDIYGFRGGTEYDGSPTYVGYGNNDDCTPKQNPCPGYILLNTEFPSVRMTCSSFNGMTFDSKDSHYLLNHPNLKWVNTNISDLMNIDDALTIESQYWKFMFGRILFRGEYRLGKVQLNNYKRNKMGLYISQSNFDVLYFPTGFQVLTCSDSHVNEKTSCSNGGIGENCQLPCGNISKIHGIILSIIF